MPALEWDKTGQRTFQGGLSRGVLYLPNQAGVPWNGLTSVTQSDDGGTMETYYLDGLATYHHVLNNDFRAVLTAFTYPEEFERLQGLGEYQPGWFVDDQRSGTFGLSYRTNIGSDVKGYDQAYKLHLLYDLTARPSDTTMNTLGESDTPTSFSWDIKGIPQAVPGFRPTAHFILDSRKIHKYKMEAVEDILYGSPIHTSSLPSFTSLYNTVLNQPKIVITEYPDGGWTADGPRELVRMIGDGIFQIDDVDAVYVDATTYNVSTTQQ